MPARHTPTRACRTSTTCASEHLASDQASPPLLLSCRLIGGDSDSHLVAALDELDGDQLARALVPGELHEAKGAAVEVPYLRRAFFFRVCARGGVGFRIPLGCFSLISRFIFSTPRGWRCGGREGARGERDQPLPDRHCAYTTATTCRFPSTSIHPLLLTDGMSRTSPFHSGDAPRGARACLAAWLRLGALRSRLRCCALLLLLLLLSLPSLHKL